MQDSIGLLVAFAAPLAVLVVLRVNAALVFLGLCLGNMLVRYVADDANTMLNLFSSHPASTVSKSTLKLVLLLAPAVCTAIFMVFSIKGRLRVLLNLLPAAATAYLGILLAVPLLAPGLRHAIESQAAWQHFVRAQAMVLGVGALVSLLFLWLQRQSKKERPRRER